MKTKFENLHQKAVQLSKSYLRAESDLIEVLQEIDDCKGFREAGYKSLFEYATQALGLSESVSFNLIAVARKSKEVPKLQEMIRDQAVSLSNARMIAPILTFDNQEKWLSAAATLTKRSLEKEIAKERPEILVTERSKYVSENRVEIRFGISEALYEKLKHVQNLISSQTCRAAGFEETLEKVLDLYIEQADPMEKAKRAKVREEKKGAHGKQAVQSVLPVPGQVKSDTDSKTTLNTRFIPAKLEHAILLRDQSRCTYQSQDGRRCTERRWLDIHHVRPLSQGGLTTLENLKLVCRGHHRVLHH